MAHADHQQWAGGAVRVVMLRSSHAGEEIRHSDIHNHTVFAATEGTLAGPKSWKTSKISENPKCSETTFLEKTGKVNDS